MITCTACSSSNVDGAVFCDTCGATLAQATSSQPRTATPASQSPAALPAASSAPSQASGGGLIECPQCHHKNPATNLFCDNDGFPLKSVTPGAAAAATSAPADVAPTLPPPLLPPPPATRAVKLVLAGSGQEVLLPDKPEVLLGRKDPTAGVFPEVDTTAVGGLDAGVSRRHCMILRQGDQLLVEDLESLNGTYVNDVSVRPNQPRGLNSGDRMRVGQLTFTVQF